MTTQQIQFFLTVAQHLNFTEAARRLFMAQPTLSKQIAAMEKELDIKLFYRTNRSVALTPAGKLLYHELSAVENQLDMAFDRARQVDMGTEGQLTIGILDIADPYLCILPIIQQFSADYPNVDISIEVHPFHKLRERLENGKLDVIFTKQFEMPHLPPVETVLTYKHTQSIMLPKTHRLANETGLYVDQLKDEYFIVFMQKEVYSSVQTLIELCSKDGFYPKIIKYANSNMARTLYVELGYGITITDRVISIPKNSNLKTIPLYSKWDKAFEGKDLLLAWVKEALNPTITLFADVVKNYVRQMYG